MLKKVDFSKILPYIVAVLFFIVLSFAYFSPLLEGKRMNQHDLKTFKGGAKEIADYREETGEEALWTNRMFVGMPAYLISTKYHGNLLQHVNRILQIGPRPASQLILLMLGGFILFLALRINPWLSILGAIAFAFSSYNFIIILAGHNTKVIAIAYVAPVLAGIFMTFRGRRLLGASLTGIFLSLQILANHPQITYYTLFIILFFGLSELYFSIKEKQLKELFISAGVLVAVVALAVLSNYSRLATTMEYSDYSMRSETELSQDEGDQTGGLTLSYATGWSYGIDETMTLMIPGFKGGSSSYQLNDNSQTFEALSQLDRNFAKRFIESVPMYWGNQSSTAGPVYLGVVIVFLFVLGMFILDGRFKWWILAVSVLGIMLSWGKNFMGLTEFFMHNIPGYNKFRTVSMTLVIPQITFPILAILALNKILFGNMEKAKILYGLKWAAGIVGGLSLLFLVIPSLAGDFSSPMDIRTVDALSGGNPQARTALSDSLLPAFEADRMAMLRKDAFRSLLFVLLSGGLIYLYKIREQKLNLNLVLGLFALLIIVDMWPVNKRFLNDSKFESKSKAEVPYTATPADQAILQSPGKNERVLNLTVSTFQDGQTSYFHQSIGGYHGAKMRRYQDLINTRMIDEMQLLIGALQQQNMNALDSTISRLNLLNMLNTRHIILNPNTAPLENMYAMGNAWFVNELRYVENADQELADVTTIDLKQTAIADIKYSDAISSLKYKEGLADRINLVDYKPNKLTYESSSNAERLAVFSEIYYEKGWEATIDGELADHIRVDYLLRGLLVPEGEHTIVFEFKPRSYYMGEKVSYAGSALLILFLMGVLFLEFRKRKD
ncbi:YfhO family protein [Bacteroidota bacterium]